MHPRDPFRKTIPHGTGRFARQGLAASRQSREFFTMSSPD
jgi:hypothetical protein